MIFTKGANQKAKFQSFDCSGEISPNLCFDMILLLKIHKVLAKKYGGVMPHDIKRELQDLKKNWLVVYKMT